ncbi:MAG: hypothetical protein B7Y41_02100 [Hydrogenophilales bacterium 28-61-23]|nr:MAG: hypothetical protein B7Y41_02100 [Hydrogenophilales bacterium 28-61-23]
MKLACRQRILAIALMYWAGLSNAQVEPQTLVPASTEAGAQVSASDLLGAISGPEATQALRESLQRGARTAIAELGRENGFFGDPKRKIGLPKNFAKADSILRGMGHGKKVDDLILAMNRAAEAASPKAEALVLDAVQKMTIDDAKAILTGGDNAATEYFRKTTEQQLAETLMPVIKSVTKNSEFVRAYGKLAGILAKFGIKSEQDTVERYVNKKALEGIYSRIGEEERHLRANPSQYAGSLLGKVFGLLK